MTRAAILALVAVALGGCDRCAKKKSPTPTPTRTTSRETPTGPARTGPTRESGPPTQVRPNKPLEVEEANAMMPTLAGTPLGAAAPSGNGSQVRTPYCLDAASLADAGRAAEQALRDAGWDRVTGRSPDDSPSGRYGIAAERADLRIAITIESAGRPDCSAADGKFFATATMSKILVPAAPP